MSALAMPERLPQSAAPRRRGVPGLGLGLSIVGHVALFGLLSLTLLTPQQTPPPQQPVEVSFADDVATVPSAPQNERTPAESQAPEVSTPEDAAPPPEEPDTGPAPEPRPVPEPQPRPRPEKSEPKPKPEKVEPKPAPETARPKPEKVDRTPRPRPEPKTADTRPKVASPVAPLRPKLARPDVGNGDTGTRPKSRGSRLDNSFRKGLTTGEIKAPAATPKAATMSAKAATDIASRIREQVQPCANRQVSPGGGAERIRVIVQLSLSKDGSLKGPPSASADPTTVDDANRRYVQQMEDRAVSVFMGCSPLRGLPLELYDVPNGWSKFRLRVKVLG